MTDNTRARNTVIIGAAAAAFGAATVLIRRFAPSRTGSGDGVVESAGVRRLYDRIAPIYDIAASPYTLIGGRRLAGRGIDELRLDHGDTVVELGTGTGWNLPRLAKRVGASGTVIGVDISPGMLEQARQRITAASIDNVELVEADISTYQPPPATNAVIATFAIERRPDYDDIIARLSNNLGAGGRIVTTGLRNPDRWPERLIRVASNLNRLFRVSKDYRDHRPWESIIANTSDTLNLDSHAGAVYLAAGTT